MSKQPECRSSLDTVSDMADAAAGAVMPLVLLVAVAFLGLVLLTLLNAAAGGDFIGAVAPLLKAVAIGAACILGAACLIAAFIPDRILRGWFGLLPKV